MKPLNLILLGIAILTGALLVMAMIGQPVDWWLTRDQQATRLMEKGEFIEAAEMFEDPIRAGIAFYRAAEFEKAAASFGRADNMTSAFNRGNALVMMGKYDGAVASYDRALQFAPAWKEAMDNRAIAIARRDRMKPTENEGGTEGQLGADEIVFDDRAKDSPDSQEVEVGKGDEMSDVELRELWLNRVQTKPADFLKIKFSYQLSKQSAGEGQQ